MQVRLVFYVLMYSVVCTYPWYFMHMAQDDTMMIARMQPYNVNM